MNRIERIADLGGMPIRLLGHLPRTGEWLHANFALPAAGNAVMPLTPAQLGRGLVIVSTLPNIRRHACISQILKLDVPVSLGLAGVTLLVTRDWYKAVTSLAAAVRVRVPSRVQAGLRTVHQDDAGHRRRRLRTHDPISGRNSRPPSPLMASRYRT
jgi:hypothetical protein